MEIKINGISYTFHGSIGPLSSDNLGAHSIGGFVESFNSLRVCRVCMGTSNDIQTKFTQDQYQLRTRASHNRHCQLVHNDQTLSSSYGVKRSSILNQSRSFHVVDGLDVDVIHDQLEVVLPLEIKLLLKKYINMDKYFTLDILNERISSFNYPLVDASNKPSSIKQQVLSSDSASLSQSASQMWCLARMLPLLIGDFIPVADDCWENFLRLLKIEEIVFAPRTSTQLAAYLALLVEEYLTQFSELNERRMIPKQHYMVHYPTQIVRRGPLVRNWAMRFEAKHNYFKKLIDCVNNFKNIAFSLARRHQALQAYLLQSSAGNYLRTSLEVGPGTKTTVRDSCFEHELQAIYPQINENSNLTITSWSIVFGTKYCKGHVIVAGIRHATPIFGEINKVLVLDGSEVLLQYAPLRVIQFTTHLNAYEVERGNGMSFIKQSDLEDFHPLGLCRGFGCNSTRFYVILKYNVDCLQ